MMNGFIHQLSSIGFPQDFLIKSIFYILCGLTIYFAFRIVISRNIFHTAIFLAMVLLGVACIYLYLDAEFIALIQVLIYVGAIVTLFLFAIMLTAHIEDRAIKQTNKLVAISLFSVLAFLLLLFKVIVINPWQPAKEGTLSLTELGTSLMTTYVLPFEVISLILVAVLVGAIVIARIKK